MADKSLEERRSNPRAGISFPVECEPLSRSKYFCTVCKDLSVGGIKIISSDFIPKNSLLKVHVNLIDTVVDLKAKLVWCNKERLSERYSAGLKFVEINAEGKKALSQLLERIFPPLPKIA